MRSTRALPVLSAIFLVGMVLPIVVGVLAHDQLAAYVTGRQFGALVAIAFAFVTTALLAVSKPNRSDVVLASFVMPGVVALGVLLLGGAWGYQAEGFQYLFAGWVDVGLYSTFFAVAGLAVTVLLGVSERTDIDAEQRAATQPRDLNRERRR